MANTKISQLPSWSGTAADLRWFVMNNSGETETFKFSGWTSQIIPADGSNSVRSIYFDSNKNKSPYGVLIGGANTNEISSTGNYNAIVGGEGCTITAGEDNGIFVAKNSTTDASSSYSVIIGGRTHTINNQFGFIGGGAQNTCGYLSATIGGFNLNASNQGVVIGGESNTQTGGYSTIIGGVNNLNSGGYSVVGGGLSNNIAGGNHNYIGAGSSNSTDTSQRSGIVAGQSNYINGVDSFIGGGTNNVMGNVGYCAIVGGTHNELWNSYNFNGGGYSNRIYAYTNSSYCGFVGGYNNEIESNSSRSTILGGTDNVINTSENGGILGGINNRLSGHTYSTMLGCSGRTSVASATTHVENSHAFRTYSTSVQAEVTGTTFTCDLNNGGKAQFFITNAATINITNVRDGQSFSIKTQTNGNYSVTWTSTGYTFKFSDGGVQNPGNSTIDIFEFEVFGNVIYGNRKHNYT